MRWFHKLISITPSHDSHYTKCYPTTNQPITTPHPLADLPHMRLKRTTSSQRWSLWVSISTVFMIHDNLMWSGNSGALGNPSTTYYVTIKNMPYIAETGMNQPSESLWAGSGEQEGSSYFFLFLFFSVFQSLLFCSTLLWAFTTLHWRKEDVFSIW